MNILSEFILNNWFLLVCFLIVAVCYLATFMGASSGVSVQEAVGIINSETIVILDTRGEKLFNEGHISGAMLLSNSEIDSLSNEILKYKEKTVLVYCESGLSSGSFVKKLEEKGFGRVKYIKGGLVSWRQENYPIETGVV